MIGPNLDDLFPYYSTTSFITNAILGGTSNQLTVYQFKLLYSIAISRVSIVVTGAQAASTVNFGIYSAAGNKLLDSGGISTASTGAQHNTITTVTLSPGIYYFAQSTSNTSVTVQTLAPATLSDVNMLNALSIKVAQAANLTVGGVMPATLGTLTADSVFAGIGLALFEV